MISRFSFFGWTISSMSKQREMASVIQKLWCVSAASAKSTSDCMNMSNFVFRRSKPVHSWIRTPSSEPKLSSSNVNKRGCVFWTSSYVCVRLELDVWACKYHGGSGTSPFTQNSSVPLPLTSQLEKVGLLVVTVEEELLRSDSRNFNGGVGDHCRERMTLGFGQPCRN